MRMAAQCAARRLGRTEPDDLYGPLASGGLMPDADDELAGDAVVLHVVVGLWHLL
jgi:hypothetical protein